MNIRFAQTRNPEMKKSSLQDLQGFVTFAPLADGGIIFSKTKNPLRVDERGLRLIIHVSLRSCIVHGLTNACSILAAHLFHDVS